MCRPLFGQYVLDYKHFTQEDGLISNTITCIHKDQRGLIWLFFEKGGLMRYDGYSFEQVNTSPHAVPDYVIHLVEDEQGNFWLHKYKNDTLWYFNPLTNEMYPHTPDFEGHRLIGLRKLREGRMYVLSDTMLYQIKSQEEGLVPLFFLPAEVDWDIYFRYLMEDQNGHFWLGTYRDGIYELSQEGTVLNHYCIDTKVRDGWQESDGSIWFVGVEGLYRKRPEENEFVRINVDHPLVEEIEESARQNSFLTGRHLHGGFRDPFGNYWIDYDAEEFSVFNPEKRILYNLEDNYNLLPLRVAFGDENQTVWVSTANQGLYQFSMGKEKIQRWLTGISYDNFIHSITQDSSGNIYINSLGGLKCLDPHTGDLSHLEIRIKSDKTEKRGSAGKSPILYPKLIWGDSGGIWVGADVDQKGLFWVNPETETAVLIPGSEGKFVTTILKEASGGMWVAVPGQLMYLQAGDSCLVSRKNGGDELEDNFINCLFRDSRGCLWAGTDVGLYLRDTLLDEWKYYNLEHPSPEKRIAILDIEEDPKGFLWFCSNSEGVIQLNLSNQVTRHFSKENGELCGTYFNSLVLDENHNLWMGSDRGIHSLNTQTYSKHCIYEHDGKALASFHLNGGLKGKDGRVYFGGLKGVIAVDPMNYHAPAAEETKIILSKFSRVNGKSGSFEDLTGKVVTNGKIQLDYRDRSFNFRFALSDYRNSSGNEFAYRLNVFDTTWQYLGTQREITFPILPPGDYAFEVKAWSVSGGECSQPLVIPIHMNQAFYYSPWFIMGSLLVIVMAIFGIFRLRLRNLRNRQTQLESTVAERTQEIKIQKEQIEQDKERIEKHAEALEELDLEKSRFFANISHELRTPLTLIQAPIDELLKKEPYENDGGSVSALQFMRRSSGQLLSLIEEILDLSKLESNKLELNESGIHFRPFINRLVSAFESQSKIRRIQLILGNQIPDGSYVLIDTSKFEKIINNLLSNALKFSGEGGLIRVSIRSLDDTFEVAVSDKGQGIHPKDLPYVFDRFYQSKLPNRTAEGGTGIGLALSKRLSELMGGSLEVESKWEVGTTFLLTLPLKVLAPPDPGLLPESYVGSSEKKEVGLWKPRTSSELISQTLLVVEDHDDMRTFIKRVLSPRFQVQTAINGKEAVRMLETKELLPDLIISDIMMPEMNGLELLDQLKSNVSWQKIPVIMLTARATQEDKLQALTIGVDDYLTKPFNTDELLARVQNLLSNSNQRKKWVQEQVSLFTGNVDFEENLVPWEVEWIQKVEGIVKREVGQRQFKVTDLADEMGVSQSQLLRRIKKNTGMTPEKYIQEVKLKKALHLLENRAFPTVNEVAYAIGFDTPDYFSKLFLSRFGKRPADYLYYS